MLEWENLFLLLSYLGKLCVHAPFGLFVVKHTYINNLSVLNNKVDDP